MDAAPVQSGSKCGSDFSIERILGDRKDSRDQTVEIPDWLCCTRYRPPRLPRPTTTRSRRAGRHARVPFTAAQAAALEAAYARAPYLAPPALKALAAALQLRDDRIKIWFQNRRARERRERSTNITPPAGITLQPTTLANGLPPNTWLSQTHFSSTRNAQAFLTGHRFVGAINVVDSTNDPDSTTSQSKFTDGSTHCTESDDYSISSYDSREVEVRSESPLDIETIDD